MRVRYCGDTFLMARFFHGFTTKTSPVERLWNILVLWRNHLKPTTRSNSTKVPEPCKLLPIH